MVGEISDPIPASTEWPSKQTSTTDRGWQAIRLGEQVIDDYDRWLDALIGRDEVEQLRSVLIRIADPGNRGSQDRVART